MLHALKDCGLLKIFNIQSMKGQVELLEQLVCMPSSQDQHFLVKGEIFLAKGIGKLFP